MQEIKDSETVSYSVRDMFELVADVDHYKEFLPWCSDSRIVRREKDDVVVAEIRLGLGPVHTAFVTRNTQRRNRAIEMELVDGPFEFLEGSWQFETTPEEGCRISLDLRFEFARHQLEASFNHMFKKAMETMVRAFRERASELYGG